MLVLSVFTKYYQFKLSDIQLPGWHVQFLYLLSCATKPVSLACYCKGSNFIEEYIFLANNNSHPEWDIRHKGVFDAKMDCCQLYLVNGI